MAIREEKEEKLVVVGIKRVMSCDKCGKERELDGTSVYSWDGWSGIRAPGAGLGVESALHFCPECYPRIYAVIAGAL